MVATDLYQQDDRYYLIRKPGAPTTFATAQDYRKRLSTLKEVEAYLKEHAAQLKSIDILIYNNSPERDHPSVQALIELAGTLRLPTLRPLEYQNRTRTPQK
jgi:hypothetical protein